MSFFWSIVDALGRLIAEILGVDNLILVGELEVVVYDKDGNIKYREHKKNVITNAGKAEVASLIGGISTSPFNYIAIGTGTSAPASTDTALEDEIARKSASASRETTNITNDTLVLVATFSSADGLTGTANVSEAGIFNAGSGGTMLARQTLSSAVPMNWDAGDAIQITWKIIVQ